MSTQPHFKISILEDNDFYNTLIRKHIENYIGTIAMARGFTFEIFSFTTYGDWQRNFKPDTDIIITDYFLNDGFNATDILEEVHKQGSASKVIVISQAKNFTTSICSLLEGASEFIHKDKRAIEKSGYIVEEIINENLKNAGVN